MSEVKWDEAFDKELDGFIRKRVMDVVNTYEGIIQRLFRMPHFGRLYKRQKKAGPGQYHQASAAGEAPAVDTAALSKGITHSDLIPTTYGYDVEIGVSEESGRAEVAEMLEFGTSTIDPRPAWRPALAELQTMIDNDTLTPEAE